MSGPQQKRSSLAEVLSKNGTSQNSSLTKVPDSNSEGENSGLENCEKIKHFQVQDVRFTPGILEFIDAYPGKQFKQKFTLQNVGRNPVSVRIGEPTSFIFVLKNPVRRNIFLASGTSITRTVTYAYHSDDMVQKSRIPIHINGELIDFPITVKIATPQLEVDPRQIDFGTINMGSEVKTLKMSIYNVGGARTRYEIDVGKNDLDLVVNPMKGTIKAKHHVRVTVEIMGMKEGIFYREIWIKTNELPIRVPILVEVVRPRLLIVYPNGTDELSAIDFPPTFIGTQRTVPFIMKNSSGETALFITVGEVNGEYQFLNVARKNHNIFNFFSLTAEEGRLEPHECRVLTALFQPKDIKTAKGWHQLQQVENKSQTEHVVFFSLNRVHCVERKEIEKACASYNPAEGSKITMTTRIKKRSSSMNMVKEKLHAQTLVDDLNLKESGIRLCLRGISIKPEVLLQPSELYIEQICPGQTVQKVVTVTNKSIIRVKCLNLKKVHVRVTPETVWIGPGKAQEFCVRVTPTCAGAFHHKMKVQILGESDVLYPTDRPLNVIAEHTIGIFFRSVYPKKVLQPKIGLGITPLITDEVGINKELVTLGNGEKIPFAARLLALQEEFKPMWMRMKSVEMDGTIVALPNDRPRGFQTWPKDKICRTIFKGSLRYAPPKDTLYTFSSEERIAKNQNCEIWANFLLVLREIREACNQGRADSGQILGSSYMKNLKLVKSDEYQKLTVPKVKSRFCGLQNCLVPLSPIYLSHVVVEPKMLNFGLVALNNSMSALLTINNYNAFSIAVMFMPGNSAVTVSESTVIVHSASEKTITIAFKLNILGRYYGFLDYVINGSHEFKITISAFVVAMSLVVEPKVMLIGNYPVTKAFQPKSMFLSMENWVQAPISYKLEFSSDAPYYSLPEEGVVPPKSKLLSEVTTNLNPRQPLSAELKFVSESGEKELLKVGQASKKLLVRFQTSRIDLKDIPLNLKTKVTGMIENDCFHDVTFGVINGNPMPGVTVEPKLGIIRARSFFPLHITIQIPVAMQFSFEIHTIIQNSHQITVSLSGNVVLPVIRIEPSIINMRKICWHSFDIATICIENAGTTPSEVEIDFRSCPECSVISGNSNLYLNPKQATSVTVKFEPKDAARFVFYLPIIINHILGPPVMQEMETENVCFYLSDLEHTYDVYGQVHDTTKSGETLPLATFSCTVASGLITVTPKSLVFQHNNKVTKSANKDNKARATQNCGGFLHFPPKTLVISNDGFKDVTFCIRTDDLGKGNDSPFDLEPVEEQKIEHRLKSMKATLEPGERLTFAVRFSPKKRGKYSVQVPIYVRGYNDGVVYCYISLSGELNSSILIPEVEEIHFHPVPLNVSTETTFTITAENYHKPDVICCLICESKENGNVDAQCLTITWLVGPEVTELRGQQKFPIQVSFKSSQPVALRCYLVFVDSSGNYCSILLSAVADNSSVTLYSLLNFFTSKYRVVKDFCTPPVWKADEHPVLFYPFDKAHLHRSEKQDRKNSDVESVLFPNPNSAAEGTIVRGFNLIIQGNKLTNNVGLVTRKKDPEESVNMLPDIQGVSQAASLFTLMRSLQSKGTLHKMDVTFPKYPNQEDLYKKHCDNTLQYTERWIYEVVMRCDQYFMIPSSFRICKSQFEREIKSGSRVQKSVVDFLSEIYGEAAVPRLDADNGPCLRGWENRLLAFYKEMLRMLESEGCFLPHVRVEYLLCYEDYLESVKSGYRSQTIKPIYGEPRANMSAKFSSRDLYRKVKSDLGEHQYAKNNSVLSNKEWFSTKSVLDTYPSPSPFETDANFDKDDADRVEMESHSRHVETVPEEEEEFQHEFEVLEETEFNQRSTQAWLDIITQIFRHSVLKKLVYKSTIPEVQVVEPGEKIPFEKMRRSQVSLYGGGKEPMNDPCTSNLYSVQEWMLLLWLNHHLHVQKNHLWEGNYNARKPKMKNKIVSNFQNDLSDSLALISVTASYCPYVVPEYFCDCFPEPDTLNKICHNAARLVQAWRELNIGLTVETIDIVQPNNIFMLMLVAHLYEVLPELHPRYLVCFEASLSSYQARKFAVQTDLEGLIIEPKLLGEDNAYFTVNPLCQLESKKKKSQDIKVTFSARKIKRMRATLLLNGCVESPFFGKGLAYFLEGQLTELTESQKMSFSAPLYKVICTEIPIRPPYPETTVYEIWYGTAKPVLTENYDILSISKPWSKIYLRKVCRRLYLNNSEILFTREEKKFNVNVTVACFTRKDRFFWLLFRSEKGDFIVRIKVRTKIQKKFWASASCWYPNPWPSCVCPKTIKEIRTNWADLRSCPLISVIKLPSRNADLWTALKTMFLKCLQPQEKMFWMQYFEKDIGLCILRWLLSPDEEEEVIDEFLPLLQTNITYNLTVFDPNKRLTMPEKIEIKDVRKENFTVPVHVTEWDKSQTVVEMKSESGMEVRKFIVHVNSLKPTEDEEEKNKIVIVSDTCQPCTAKTLKSTPPKTVKKSKKLAKLC